MEALPGPLGAFVECLAESTQTPEEMGGTLSLGVLATAFQRRYEVEVTRDWREPLCLYSSAVAPPGERKSAVISALNKPIYEYEAEVRAVEAAEIAQNQTERALLEKALEAAKNSAAKGKANFEEMRAEALELSGLRSVRTSTPFASWRTIPRRKSWWTSWTRKAAASPCPPPRAEYLTAWRGATKREPILIFT